MKITCSMCHYLATCSCHNERRDPFLGLVFGQVFHLFSFTTCFVLLAMGLGLRLRYYYYYYYYYFPQGSILCVLCFGVLCFVWTSILFSSFFSVFLSLVPLMGVFPLFIYLMKTHMDCSIVYCLSLTGRAKYQQK